MKLLLKHRFDNEFDIVLDDVKEYEESYHDRKIFVLYNDGKREAFSIIQYGVYYAD